MKVQSIAESKSCDVIMHHIKVASGKKNLHTFSVRTLESDNNSNFVYASENAPLGDFVHDL